MPQSKKSKGKTILALCAHNDDQVIGAGGTLSNLTSKGMRLRTIIFSFGELSHPHLKPEIIISRRIKEALQADKIIGGNGVAYLGLKEGRFLKDGKEALRKLKAAIKQEKPALIFTHSSDDPHPDHRAVSRHVQQLVDSGMIKVPVFTFDVWNILRLKERGLPKLVVDVSRTFNTKMRALACHKSQKLTIVTLFGKIWLKAKLAGFRNGWKYAETFHRIDRINGRKITQ